jgi:hypothetical protein
MGLVFRLIELFWLILPIAGVIIAGWRAWSAYEKRRAGQVAEAPAHIGNDVVYRREISRAIDAHNRTDRRWLDYEMDVAKLLDFPMMTEMREPLTVRFHKAKLRADMLRPATVEDLLGDRDAQAEYLEAVQHYVTAFDAAETEAIRRRRSDFSAEDMQRLTRAQRLLRLASDSAATQEERRHAYDRARKELDGLIVLPAGTHASIEGGITGEIEGKQP